MKPEKVTLSHTVGQIADCIILSLIWLIGCLPIITIGAATTAMYYTADKVIHRGEGKLWATFGKIFAREFKQATILGLLVTVFYVSVAIAGVMLYSLYATGNDSYTGFVLPLVLITIVVTFWAQYWFAYLARFKDKTSTLLKNTLSIAIIDLRRSILLLLMFVATIVVGAICFVYLPAINILLPAAYAYTANRIYEKVFAPYLPDEEAIPVIGPQNESSK